MTTNNSGVKGRGVVEREAGEVMHELGAGSGSQRGLEGEQPPSLHLPATRQPYTHTHTYIYIYIQAPTPTPTPTNTPVMCPSTTRSRFCTASSRTCRQHIHQTAASQPQLTAHSHSHTKRNRPAAGRAQPSSLPNRQARQERLCSSTPQLNAALCPAQRQPPH
jgi:hypothetical protein